MISFRFFFKKVTIFIFQAQFDAGELITQRDHVSQKVSEELTDRANQFGLVLDDISLVRPYNMLIHS